MENKKKPYGYWSSKERCEEAAKNCRNIREFGIKYNAALRQAKIHGWVKEISEKCFTNKKMFQSFESPIHVVYAYEITEHKSVYVGRTTSVKRRDRDHRKPEMNDSLFRFCSGFNIEIPEPIVKEENLTAPESQDRENYWVEKYADDGWYIINKMPTGIGSGSLGATAAKWTYDTCKELAATCKNKEEFKKKSSRAHNVSRENGWIDEFFPEPWRTPDGSYDNIENCKRECTERGYKKLTDVKHGYPFLYRKICEHKWNDEFREFFGNTKYKHYNKKAGT